MFRVFVTMAVLGFVCLTVVAVTHGNRQPDVARAELQITVLPARAPAVPDVLDAVSALPAFVHAVSNTLTASVQVAAAAIPTPTLPPTIAPPPSGGGGGGSVVVPATPRPTAMTPNPTQRPTPIQTAAPRVARTPTLTPTIAPVPTGTPEPTSIAPTSTPMEIPGVPKEGAGFGWWFVLAALVGVIGIAFISWLVVMKVRK